tara:strand:- start:267 stop:395 length:129 start_codon:yes stop_codon:yes gene_type:complete
MFGVIDNGHPYIKHINSGGEFLLGGEVEVSILAMIPAKWLQT